MSQKAFEINKLRRLLGTSGKLYEFKRKGTNAYNEPTEEETIVAVIRGVYHETYARVTVVLQESSKIRSMPQPTILCLWDDYVASGLTVGDELTIGPNKYTLQGAVNVQKMDVAADITLELVQDNGTKF